MFSLDPHADGERELDFVTGAGAMGNGAQEERDKQQSMLSGLIPPLPSAPTANASGDSGASSSAVAEYLQGLPDLRFMIQ